MITGTDSTTNIMPMRIPEGSVLVGILIGTCTTLQSTLMHTGPTFTTDMSTEPSAKGNIRMKFKVCAFEFLGYAHHCGRKRIP